MKGLGKKRKLEVKVMTLRTEVTTVADVASYSCAGFRVIGLRVKGLGFRISGDWA